MVPFKPSAIHICLPSKDVRNAKNDDVGEDIEEITNRKDTHKLVKIVSLVAEPDDEADITNNTNDPNKHLNRTFSELACSSKHLW